MGLLELLVEVLKVLLQHSLALLQLPVPGAVEAVAPCLQLWDGNKDTETCLDPRAERELMDTQLL